MTTSNLDKVTWTDGLMAAISLALTAAGLVILRTDLRMGIVTIVFFGACSAVAVRVIHRKWRVRRLQAGTVSIAGGVPIRPSRARAAAVGALLLYMGFTLAVFWPRHQVVMVGVGGLIGACGGALLGGLALGWLPRGYLRFDPAGITFGTPGGEALVPWDAVMGMARGDIHNNQAVFLSVDLAAVTASPAAHLDAVHRQAARSHEWMGAHFVIMSSAYGIDAPVMLAALQRYVADPVARHELRGRAPLPNESR